MKTPTLSLVINHVPWKPERALALEAMLKEICPAFGPDDAIKINDTDYRGTDWQKSKVKWFLDQLTWSWEQTTDWHVFATDDLHLMPGFVEALRAMLEAAPTRCPVGLLSNHPRAPRLADDGFRWYATNSWLVGPCYAVHCSVLPKFRAWYMRLPDGNEPGQKGYRNDDSSWNEWVTYHGGGRTLHPLPTIIEHRADLESTVGHGDQYSRERVSWREERIVLSHPDPETRTKRFEWECRPRVVAPEILTARTYWTHRGGPEAAPLMTVGGE